MCVILANRLFHFTGCCKVVVLFDEKRLFVTLLQTKFCKRLSLVISFKKYSFQKFALIETKFLRVPIFSTSSTGALFDMK
jgi:hypothetical protein